MKVIYLDIDGVLAKWIQGVFDMLDIHSLDTDVTGWNGCNAIVAKERGISEKEAERLIWKSIDARGQAFWEHLEWYDSGKRLYQLCNRLAPTILVTSPGSHPSSSSGKHAWIRKHSTVLKNLSAESDHRISERYPLKAPHRRFAICPSKAMLAHPRALLIDDREKNVEQFKAGNGQAFLWPRAWNSNRDMSTQQALQYVTDMADYL